MTEVMSLVDHLSTIFGAPAVAAGKIKDLLLKYSISPFSVLYTI